MKMDSDKITVRWSGNNSTKYDGKDNIVLKKHVIHTDGRNVVIQYKKGGKTWKGIVVEEVDTCDSDDSEDFPLFTAPKKRTTEQAGITPTRREAKNKKKEKQGVLKPRSLHKVDIPIMKAAADESKQKESAESQEFLNSCKEPYGAESDRHPEDSIDGFQVDIPIMKAAADESKQKESAESQEFLNSCKEPYGAESDRHPEDSVDGFQVDIPIMKAAADESKQKESAESQEFLNSCKEPYGAESDRHPEDSIDGFQEMGLSDEEDNIDSDSEPINSRTAPSLASRLQKLESKVDLILTKQQQILDINSQLLDIINHRARQGCQQKPTQVQTSVTSNGNKKGSPRPTYVQLQGNHVVLGDLSIHPSVLVERSRYNSAFYSSQSGQQLVLKLMELLFDKHTLSTSNVAVDPASSLKPQLNARLLEAIFSQVELEFSNFQASNVDRSALRSAINSKCRHIKCRCQICSSPANHSSLANQSISNLLQTPATDTWASLNISQQDLISN